PPCSKSRPPPTFAVCSTPSGAVNPTLGPTPTRWNAFAGCGMAGAMRMAPIMSAVAIARNFFELGFMGFIGPPSSEADRHTGRQAPEVGIEFLGDQMRLLVLHEDV